MKQTELEQLVRDFTDGENQIDFNGLNEKINKDHINDVIAKNKPDVEKLQSDFQSKLLEELGFENLDAIKALKENVPSNELKELQERYDKLQSDFDESNKTIKAGKREKLLKDVPDEFREFIGFKLDALVSDEVDETKALEQLREDEKFSQYFPKQLKIKSTGKSVKKPKGEVGDSEFLDAFNKKRRR